jgi:hypothetical protein
MDEINDQHLARKRVGFSWPGGSLIGGCRLKAASAGNGADNYGAAADLHNV